MTFDIFKLFTGIIKKTSKVVSVSRKGGSFFVWIEKPKGWSFGKLRTSKIRVGESISINGVCSTIRAVKGNKFEVEYMPETLEKTTMGNFQRGSLVNLEKSLRMSDLLDGHLVLGHVDCRGKVMEIIKSPSTLRPPTGGADRSGNNLTKIIKIKVPGKFMKFIAEKGSVAVDGISLTVVDTGKDWFTVSLVSYTLENTNLGNMKIGEEVNIETDVIAKYIVNYFEFR